MLSPDIQYGGILTNPTLNLYYGIVDEQVVRQQTSKIFSKTIWRAFTTRAVRRGVKPLYFSDDYSGSMESEIANDGSGRP